MNRLIKTNDNSLAALIARLAIAITIFPHGAQKLFGWFGGSGFDGTMYYFTEMVGIPWILGLLVILVEVFAPIMLILGSYTIYKNQ
ncbi:MAG: DoxX family protein [Saprospiraceae bacterium]|nr:DoxX family protein [Saprospiraceae bacterium]